MADKIGSSGDSPNISPADRKMYKNEYKHAADLFERTLNEDVKSNNMYQQDEFRKVMEQSVQVLKETATALHQDKLMDQANKIEEDLAAYQKDRSPASIFELHKDLEKAKKG